MEAGALKGRNRGEAGDKDKEAGRLLKTIRASAAWRWRHMEAWTLQDGDRVQAGSEGEVPGCLVATMGARDTWKQTQGASR